MAGSPAVFAFFVKATPENQQCSLNDWAQRAGLHSLRPQIWPKNITYKRPEYIEANWVDGMYCEACVERYQEHFCFQIYTSWTSIDHQYLENVPWDAKIPLAKDPRLPVAHAFRNACLALHADIAWYATYIKETLNEDIQEQLQQHYTTYVLPRELPTFLYEGSWRILYLDPSWTDWWPWEDEELLKDDKMYMMSQGQLTFRDTDVRRF